MIIRILERHKRHLCAVGFDLPPDRIEVGDELPRRLRFNDRGLLLLDLDTCEEEELRVGSGLSEAGLLRLIGLSDFNRAKSKALWFLSRRSFASGELRMKLKFEFGETAAADAVERMTELGLIHDEDYAAYLAQQLLQVKKVSARDAVYRMTARGVDRETAQEAVDALEPDAGAQIRALLETKYKNALSDEKGIRRTTAALARRGFAYDDVRSAIRQYADDEFEDE